MAETKKTQNDIDKQKLSIAHPLPLSRSDGITLYASIGVLCVMIAYVFLVSAGTWTNWTTSTTYYNQLAVSFSRGKLSLEQLPDPALLALDNPYDPESRAGVPHLPDISLYNGRYYLYFGAVPALLLTPIKFFSQREISDPHLVFAFATGIFLIQTGLLIKVLRRFLTDIPSWLVLPGILVAGMVSPYGWMLGLGSIHNASILGGQFFFFAGLYSSISALENPSRSRVMLALTSFFWVCAIGSRMTQIIPVGFMVIMVLAWIFYRNRQFPVAIFKIILPITLPIITGVVLLGWYNWARFDSVFEFGITYQLAGPNLQKHKGELYSLQYTANNIYNYFLIKPEIKERFPFLNPVRGYSEPIIKHIHLPDIYFSQETVGLFYIAPFIFFALPAFLMIFALFRKGAKNFGDERPAFFYWLMISLFGSFLFPFVFYLLFFWASVRYQAEFIPALTIMSVIGFWQTYRYLAQKPFAQIPYTVFAVALIIVTVVNSTLVAIAINSARYREFSPELWDQFTRLFS